MTTLKTEEPQTEPLPPLPDLTHEIPSEERELPLDVVFDILSNERRRLAMRYLLETPKTTLGDLAEHIASIENGKPEAALSSTERKRVYIGLYQCHLPRMDDAGVIEFDPDRKTILTGNNLPHVARFLPAAHASRADSGHHPRWRRIAIGVKRVAKRCLPISP